MKIILDILKVKHLKKSFFDINGEINILKDINLEVKEGDFISITGQSGCGKSTLLHILGLLDEKDAGEILYFGKEISIQDKTINEFRKIFLGFIFQYHYLLKDFTALENVAIPMFLKTGDKKSSLLEAKSLLQQMGMLERKDHYPNKLSGGEAQRVSIARALINKPKLILADEPTGNLDPKISKEVFSIIENLNKENKQAFILVTHNMEIAQRTKTNYKLDNGKLEKIK